MRGLAIAMVVVSHIDARLFPIGAAGVVLFFVLSGYLITDLLLEERTATGRISLTKFYQRRARRLLPALLAYLVIVTPLALWLAPRDANLLSAVSTLFYVANWHQALDPYHVGVFGQMWSLGIEEQFYLTWPLILIGVLALRKPAWLPIIATTVVAGSIVARTAFGLSDEWALLFFGTPWRLDAIALGCLLALRPLRGGYRLGLALLFVAALMPQGSPQLLIGLSAASVGSASFIATVLRTVPPWLTLPPLVSLGRISYGLYLWHAPIFFFLPSVPWPVRVILAVGVAIISYRFVERPFRASSEHLPVQPMSRAVPAVG